MLPCIILAPINFNKKNVALIQVLPNLCKVVDSDYWLCISSSLSGLRIVVNPSTLSLITRYWIATMGPHNLDPGDKMVNKVEVALSSWNRYTV